ncbi:hypothetical protein LX64_03762 [Chitinophaga skermanii]|uniref:Uncharacterized protein n=1 Tax=Chitinophaga skermanii TaxID=331697 RepID=A0A327QA82_9BACT|nr:hypothetical protein [Chitinophaga skermanii]RAJ01546.1 hypothetical protein LX64_03762 [Chitinophaga skermanii]
MHHQPTSLPKIAGISSLIIGIAALVLAYLIKEPKTALTIGAIGLAVSSISALYTRRTTTEDLQLSVAGIIYSLFACAVGYAFM